MIRRTYRCEVCGDVFEVTCESNDPDPPCPYCEKTLQWQPGMFALKTNISRGAEVAQQILEEDYQLTNFNEGTREGDTVYKAEAETREQREAKDALEQQAKMLAETAQQPVPAAQTFWAGSQGGVPPMLAQTMVAGAKSGPQGIDPIKSLHDRGRAGKLPNNFTIIARG